MARIALRIAVGVLMATVPFAAAVLAVVHAPAATVEIAGEPVSVKPVLGQRSSRLFAGALVQPTYAEVPVLGKPIGVDIDANFNRLVPSDKATRSYLTALWENPDPAIDRIEETARHHLLTWAAIGFGAGLVADAAVVGLVLHRRRRLAAYPPDQADLIDRFNRPLRRGLVVLGVVTALVLDVAAVRAWTHEDDRPVIPSPALAGTGLQGTQVTGLLADALPFLSVLKPRSEFYDKVSANLEKTLAERPSLTRKDGEVAFVLAEDFEDVNGMARQVGLTAKVVDASFIALSGDLTFAGRPEETYLLDTIDYYSEKRPVWFAPGLHDTKTITDAAQARGWHLADGQSHDIDGLTLLPASDPRISTVGDFGTGTVPRDPAVDVDSFVTDTAAESCATSTDFVLLHDHVLGRKIAETGCQQVAVLDGRSYQFVGPQHLTTDSGEPTIEFTSGSAGGHDSTVPNPGVITNPARFSILYYDPASGSTSYAVVTVSPDASVTVTPRTPLGSSAAIETTSAH